MKKITAEVVSVHIGSGDDLDKHEQQFAMAKLDGFVADGHRGHSREAWTGDKQPQGTIRRNERQWSAVSVEELGLIGDAMMLNEPLSATSLGANLCLRGVENLSRLPKGSVLAFPSGAELSVEEYNPPCHDMGKKLAKIHTTKTGEALPSTAFSKAAKFLRGVVGVVEVPGEIRVGDEVSITVYEHPSWLS